MYHKVLLRERGDFGAPVKSVLFVTETEHIFRTEINKMYHTTGIYRRLVYRMDTEISTLLPVCAEAVSRLKRLFVVMRTQIFSQDLTKQSTSKKNCKASEVLHL